MIWKTNRWLQGLLLMAVIVATASFLLWSLVSVLTMHAFRVHFFDVGQGDAILVRTEGGQNILIDGGPDRSIVYKLEKVLPWYDRTIDVMVLTHPHADHVAGLIEVAKRYHVARVVSTGMAHTTPEYLAWLDLLKKKKLAAASFKEGDTLMLDHRAKLTALAPPKNMNLGQVKDLNDTSLVLFVETPNIKILLTGDAQELIEKDMLATHEDFLQHVDVLKVGHHGSRNATTKDFLDIVKPRYAIISAGAKNQFGHPHLETLARLRAAGADIFRTDESGDIILTENKTGFQITTARK